MLACVCGAYLIVGINCYWVALIWKYMCMGIHIWKYLDLHSAYLITGWAEMKLLCRYTNNEMCSSTSYAIYERTYVCHCICR